MGGTQKRYESVVSPLYKLNVHLVYFGTILLAVKGIGNFRRFLVLFFKGFVSVIFLSSIKEFRPPTV